jgi:hypothetical protein
MPERSLPAPRDDGDRKLLADVAGHGWHVVGVLEDDEGPGYAFSVGMFHTLGHPEILLMGLQHSVAHRLVNDMGDAIRRGERYEPGQKYDGLAAGFPLAFVSRARRYYREYLGYALWLYQGPEFPALQCVWPDKAGKFPWEPGYDSRFFDLQRVLGPK